MSNRVFLIFCAILILILVIRITSFFFDKQVYMPGQSVLLVSRLINKPVLKGKLQTFWLTDRRGERVYVVTTAFPRYDYGQVIEVSGTAISSNNGQLLRFEKTAITVQFPKIVVKNETGLFGKTLAVFVSIREHLIRLFYETFSKDTAALLLGITFGISDNFSSDFSTQLRAAGVYHVVVASGMNVAMVCVFLQSITALFFKRHISLLISLFGVFSYMILAGFEPPIVRASIMGSIALLAQFFGKQSKAVYALFLTGFAMLMASPYLLTSLSFHLSFGATLGLLFIKPIFDFVLKRQAGKIFSIVSEDASTTIAAQIATFPLIITNFGSYSILSLFANILTLWVVPFVMVLGALGALVSFFVPVLGKLVLYITIPFLLYFTAVVELISLVGFTFAFPKISWQITTAYYCFVIAGIVWFDLRRRDKNAQ